ncbi:MAG: hypothetical protein KKD83_08450 [Chloroflexi bacterium]|nr:hypothetical protein [Chloroflexota bacterium]
MNIVIIVFFIFGLLVLIYTAWLGIKFYRASKRETDDVTRLETKIDTHEQKYVELMQTLIDEVKG